MVSRLILILGDLEQARREHQEFCDTMRSAGVDVVRVEDVLLAREIFDGVRDSLVSQGYDVEADVPVPQQPQTIASAQNSLPSVPGDFKATVAPL